ncbi:hypothetical protein DOM21_03685 [Bacteriovorax stolpii]|uniref:hypothetical protein n=1 Tax=Bacteriovorax stolpii TaxID=960 RepID=UPI001158A281|nr:hypothetical protein [Bacteriovorax stolpii]QDK40567.1 hypothetical protein DOM21_03685 [Bacteriovorax stolpii]
MSKKAKKPTSKSVPKYPRHDVEKALRIPEGILKQNAGKECSEADAAKYIGMKYNKGPFSVEISSCKKYGFIESSASGKIRITELAKKILRPQSDNDRISGLREAILKAPEISDIYNHYRNENLPDSQFFDNALVDKFNIPLDKLNEFKQIFIQSLKFAELINENDGKIRIIDVTEQILNSTDKTESFKKLEKKAKVEAGDSCFVIMPFASPIGDYFEKIYKPAIEKTSLKAVRADNEIFKTGKIIDQIWTGITNSRVLVAELTGRNPNVFYELGLAHAAGKPVVLICSNENDVPFDLRHIRVIYYDVNDPFWGAKLIEKVAENILSALENPKEAIFQTALQSADLK